MMVSKVTCPECGGSNIEALLRGTGYSTRAVQGLRDGKLVLAREPYEDWIENLDELDEELKCRDCGVFPNINDMDLDQRSFTIVTEDAK